ncbi:MAG: HAMP domain-containing histidine kinase [Bacteroidales bacterium]|nr:HAMP domain-containing histidine kinase [Bacteroidales bacterium]
MKNLSNIARIRIMMIAAQLLLTGFALHWLNMQYKERQQLLANEINEAWTDSQKQMIDSMLMHQYIAPALDTSSRIDFRFEFNTDSIKTVTGSGHTPTSAVCMPALAMPAAGSRIIVNISDSSGTRTINGKGDQTIMTRDLVLQGVKLFVNTHSDSSGNKPDLSSTWMMNPDTSLMKTVFFDRIRSIDPGIRIRWSADSIIDSTGRNRTFVYQMVTGDKNLEAGIDGYRLIVIREIWPQITFALLLIFLTAAAFYASLKSLKAQIILNNQRNDFIRNMSHELKTPVATVKVALEALKNFNRRNDPVVMDEYLDMATAETNRLEMLISRVMNVSAGNGGAIDPNLEQVNLNELINDVLQAFRPRIETEKAIITLNLPEQDISANLDRLHMQGALLNLIDNSLKYSTPPTEVEITLSSDKNEISISVADRGIGIPVEYRTRIFEKFFRVPTGDLHNVKGYGLGLSYAEMVMKQHGGSIGYFERPGGGSIFRLTLPITTS